jgi:hypothetical protein
MVGDKFVAMHDVSKKMGAASWQTTTHASYWQRYGISALVHFQFHMIACVDDSTLEVLEHIWVHDNIPHVLKTRLNWSKNVGDKRDALWQIVLGALNSLYCVLYSLGLWLEINIKMHPPAMDLPYVFCFTDNNRIPEGGRRQRHGFKRYQQKCSSWRNSKEMMVKQSLCCWAFTAFKSMQQHVRADVELQQRMKKILEGNGKAQVESAMFTMMSNNLTLMQKLPKIVRWRCLFLFA